MHGAYGSVMKRHTRVAAKVYVQLAQRIAACLYYTPEKPQRTLQLPPKIDYRKFPYQHNVQLLPQLPDTLRLPFL